MSEFEKPRSKRRREVVLTEEEYLRAIDDHVERDYFPETRRLKALGEVLEAEKTGNVTIVDEARERYLRVAEEIADTPRTPDTLGSETHPPPSKPPQSLDLFLRSHTSQDNLSYAKIQDQERARLRERFWWVYDSAEVEKKRQALAAPRPIPALEAPEALSLNEFQPFTNFMFAPSEEGVQRTLATFDDFSGPAKVTAKENTRLSPDFLVSVSEPPLSPTPRTPAYEELKTPQVSIPITWGQVDSTPQALDHGKRFTVLTL